MVASGIARQSNDATRKRRCTPRTSEKGATISLPIVEIDPDTGIKRSHAGRRRAYVLGALHLLMILHFVHWLRAGSTLTPIEPSESAEFFRRGEINMGFIFFGLAILATLFFGRWVCGWGCHLVAYQDLTLWILKKLRLRPKAFKTRFLFIFIPLVVAAGWMFLLPAGVRIWSMIQGQQPPEATLHLTRTGFWDTFPGYLFGGLTFLVCGIAIVYFLGPKGFCTFACPYGAFFGLADKLSPARIRVTDDCNRCGHCTAVCTSNVNVAEEVNLYRMVVDPGCMKCLDCVNVCPNDALYVGFGRPALGAKPAGSRAPRRFDLSLKEEIAALLLFLVCLVTINGLYGEFPFLMSLGTAAIATYLLLKAAQLVYTRDVLIQKLRLKIGGKLRPLGIGFALFSVVLAALLVHSAVWRYHDILANRAFDSAPPERMKWQYDSDFARFATADQLNQVAVGLRHFEACENWGLFCDAENHLHAAWLYLFTEQRDKAPGQIRKAIDMHPKLPGWWLMLAQVETFLSRTTEAREAFEHAIALETAQREELSRKAGAMALPLSSRIWREWGYFQANENRLDKAAEAFEAAVRHDPNSLMDRIILADYRISVIRDVEGGIAAYEGALAVSPNNAEVALRLAQLYDHRGRRSDAQKMLQIALHHGNPAQRQLARQWLQSLKNRTESSASNGSP